MALIQMLWMIHAQFKGFYGIQIDSMRKSFATQGNGQNSLTKKIKPLIVTLTFTANRPIV